MHENGISAALGCNSKTFRNFHQIQRLFKEFKDHIFIQRLFKEFKEFKVHWLPCEICCDCHMPSSAAVNIIITIYLLTRNKLLYFIEMNLIYFERSKKNNNLRVY